MTDDGQLGRRSLLALGVGLLVAASGCSSTGEDATPPEGSTPGTSTPATGTRGTSTSPVTSAPVTTPATTPTLPRPSMWSPSRNDVSPAVKLAAARAIEALGSWDGASGGSQLSAGRRLSAIGQPPSLAAQAGGALLGSGRSAVLEVIEAQYGGLLSTTASVLVVCRQSRIGSDGRREYGGTTVDVRLSKASPQWRVTALHPADPGPAVPHPSAFARQVLAHERIDLPPDARADVLSGKVHDSVLTAMLRLATQYTIGVSVVRSGHPIYVFGTDRRSDHPQGRAFDTWRINGHAVVDPATPEALVTGYMEAAKGAGSYNVGGPYLLAGTGNQFFSNPTHHDHVHAGFAQ